MERINYPFVLEKYYPHEKWERTPGTKLYQYDAYIWSKDNKLPMPTKEELNLLWEECKRETPAWLEFIKIRNRLLAESDTYVLPDFPHKNEEEKQAWYKYRQDLRNLPETIEEPFFDEQGKVDIKGTWPTKPN